jgi:hypothetical protein
MAYKRESPGEVPQNTAGRLFELEVFYYYVIDPRVQSCFLLYSSNDGETMAPINCQKLRANVPEAAKNITWGDETQEVPDGG